MRNRYIFSPLCFYIYSFLENKKQALEEKEKGTAAYKKKDFEAALAHYSKAQELDPDDIFSPFRFLSLLPSHIFFDLL